MRPSPAQAKAKVNQYISFLEEHGVPMALFKQRVKDIVDWGESVRLRRPVPAAPKSAEMKGIQSALDEMCRSEKYVREQRRGGYPHYPYASEEQKTLAETRPHTHTHTHTHTPHTQTHPHTRATHASWTYPPIRPPARMLHTQNRAQSHSKHTRTHPRTHTHMEIRHVSASEGEHPQGTARWRRQFASSASGLAELQAPICGSHRRLCKEIAKACESLCSLPMRRMLPPRLAACRVAWDMETLELESAGGATRW
jgi:hypothetical protein